MSVCNICLFSDEARQKKIGSLPVTFDKSLDRKWYSLWRCGNCLSFFLNPLPSQADLNVIYVDNIQFSSEEYTDFEKNKSIFDYYTKCLNQILTTKKFNNVNLLEVGAGMSLVL